MGTMYLQRWEKVKAAIIEAHSVDEVKLIRDQAEAYRYALKMAGEAPEIIRKASEIKLRAERRAGQMLEEQEKNKGGRPETEINSSDTTRGKTETLEQLGITYDQSSYWQKMAGIPEDKFEVYLGDSEELTTAGAVQLAEKPHVAHNSGENEWYTPNKFIESVRVVLGGIDLDPASSEEANKIVKADTFYTIETDGLSKDWRGKVWMNPPYSVKLIGQFVEKFCHHFECAEITEGIVLVNNATETGWFQQMSCLSSAICFPKGRITWWSPDKKHSAPLQGQAFLYFGYDLKRFNEEFIQYGWVWQSSIKT